ncbi:MAG: ABC transporter permease [Acidimicrobiia bacterium]
MSPLRAVGLVAGRELAEAFRRKSYWAVVGLLVVGSTAAMVVPDLLSDDDSTRYDVVVVGDDARLEAALTELGPSLEAVIDVTHADDAGTARRQVEDDESDVAIVLGAEPTVIVRAGQNATLVGVARAALADAALADRLRAVGLDESEVDDVLAVPPPGLLEVDVERSSRRAASFAISLVLYLLLLTLMMQVATGTAVEKANRISEVLLAIVRPGALLFGKVLGVGVSGLLVLAAGSVPVVVELAAGGSLPDGTGGALLGGGAWFVLGLAFYLTVAGALGALVERQEEVGAVVTPLTAVLVATFIVAQSGPESPLGAVLAYVPLTSPLLVPTRLAIGVTGPVELVGSLLLLVVSIGVVARVGTAMYARAIVRTDRRVRLRDVFGRPG